ncbi:DNA replication licensing factor, MCM4 component [Pseudoloma neurophilia]|uniref:DNA replication licensing factor MCM4 n=1 Tax=Pseudoloma neurophilia TaxID=146866 RepID=A0A0R0M1T4_9MICR|nr:DNA replication licensing factor, MCM4 component [Pseudoloma neurophilia]
MTIDQNLSSNLTFEASQDTHNLLTTPHDIQTDPIEPYSTLEEVYEKVKLIWGTTININETIDTFKEILSLYYSEQIKKMIFLEQNVLKLDNLYELNDKFINYPSEIIPLLKKALFDYILEIQPQWKKDVEISFSISNDNSNFLKGSLVSFKNLNTSLIDKIVMIKGIVLRISPILPELIKACYICQSCNNTIFIERVKNIINEPTICPCGINYNYTINYNKSVLIDKQILKIQEINEEPITVTVILYNDYGISPGDRVNVLGILRASAILGYNQVSNVFKGLIEGITVEKSALSSIKSDESIEHPAIEPNYDILSQDIIQENSGDKITSDYSPFAFEDRYEKLTDLIAPSIYGHRDVKKALLLMLVGGITKRHLNANLRGNINILLAGDPGVAKSQLLSFVNNISKGIYTSGNGSTAAGLSASVTRDLETGAFVLESGALTLSDRGICIIDEFDKMNLHAQGVLHESMEQQTISIAKAGIITTLNARCSVLASCNPKESVWNRNKSIRENINIVPTLLSRFDLIFILLDGNDPVVDKRMADFILNFYTAEKLISREDGITENAPTSKTNDLDVLKKEIERSKNVICTISQEASEEIIHQYILLRNKSNKNIISATTRQLDAIIRLSEAHCKTRMSLKVEKQDVLEAIRLIKESMLMYAIDPVTGKIDIDLISGRSARERNELKEVKNMIKKEIKKKKKILKQDIVEMFGEIGQIGLNELIDEEEVLMEGEMVIYYNQKE